MAEHELIARLNRFRRTVKRRLIAYGVCAVGAGGAASVLAVLAADWLLGFPAPLRLVVAALFVSGFVGATLHWVIRPLRARMGIDELAGRLEGHFSSLDDRLSSAVGFITKPDAGSAAMMRRVVDATSEVARGERFQSALSAKPLVRMAVFLAVGLATLSVIAMTSRGWVTTGVYRYLDPFGEHAWPTRVAITPLTGHQTVPIGEFAPVRLRIDRGLDPDLRAVVRFREPGGRTQSLTMQRAADGTFATTIDSVTSDVEYWFEAGDASTKEGVFRITALPRPVVVEAIAVVEPPAYAPHRPALARDMREGAIDAPIGGHVVIQLRASKPIAADGASVRRRAGTPVPPGGQRAGTPVPPGGQRAGTPVPPGGQRAGTPVPPGEQVGLRFADGGWVPLVVRPDDPHALVARFPVTESSAFRIRLVDRDGLTSQDELEYVVRARPDAPPVVQITEPRGVTEVTPNASVRLTGKVEDDFGIAEIALEAGLAEDDETAEIDLLTHTVRIDDEERAKASVAYDWSIREMELAPGDVLLYSLRATDNYKLTGGGARATGGMAGGDARSSGGEGAAPHVGRSAVQRIKVLSEAEFELRIRSDLAQLEGRIRQSALDQDDLADQVARLMRDDDEPLSPVEKETTRSVIGGQGRLASRLRELARRFEAIRDRMQENRAGTPDARARLGAMADALVQIAAGSVTESANDLQSAIDPASAEAQPHLTSAQQRQHDAADQLRVLLRSMSQWGDFENLVSKTRDLADRQAAIRRSTTELGKRTIGKRTEDLGAEEAADLASNARRQQQVAEDLDQLLRNMSDLARSLESKDPAGAESLDAALRAARSAGVSRQLERAGEAIEQNRTAAAVMNQEQAEESLRGMVDVLRERATRELAMLRKQLEESEAVVARLIERQRRLSAATDEAGRLGSSAEVFNDYADQQRDLHRDTRLLAEELLEVPRAVDAGRLVREAAGPMHDATIALSARTAAPAVAHQAQAIALLEQALESLRALADQAEEEAFRHSLARIQGVLEEMLEAQLEVNSGVGRLRQTIVEARGVVTRAEARIATRLSRSQADVRDKARDLGPVLDQVAVFRWALDRVVEWMGTTQRQLEVRAIDEALVETTVRISDELARLIDAIRETQEMPLDQEFTDASGSGGGGGAGGAAGQGPPVPKLAELLVLRAMQEDLIERTSALDAAGDQPATEARLREIKRLGEDQEQVRRLTELVTRKARHP